MIQTVFLARSNPGSVIATVHLGLPLLSVLVGLCVIWFFARAFRRNWAEVRAHEFDLSWPFLLGSALATLAAILLATYAWYASINALSSGKVDFRQSIAAANLSGLTKYIPGKVWSYALQMYFLDGLGKRVDGSRRQEHPA